MRRPALALLAVGALAACAQPQPVAPAFPPGAQTHGPYLDRSFEGFMVRAAFVQDVTVVTIQDASDAPEPSAEQLARARDALSLGEVAGVTDLAAASGAAPRFEAAAIEAATVPGWCPFGTRFAYLDPIETPLDHPFGIRASFDGDFGAFLFAGQCR